MVRCHTTLLVLASLITAFTEHSGYNFSRLLESLLLFFFFSAAFVQLGWISIVSQSMISHQTVISRSLHSHLTVTKLSPDSLRTILGQSLDSYWTWTVIRWSPDSQRSHREVIGQSPVSHQKIKGHSLYKIIVKKSSDSFKGVTCHFVMKSHKTVSRLSWILLFLNNTFLTLLL